MQTSNLLDAESEPFIISMLKKLKGREDKLRKNFNITKKGHGSHKIEPVINEVYTK